MLHPRQHIIQSSMEFTVKVYLLAHIDIVALSLSHSFVQMVPINLCHSYPVALQDTVSR